MLRCFKIQGCRICTLGFSRQTALAFGGAFEKYQRIERIDRTPLFNDFCQFARFMTHPIRLVLPHLAITLEQIHILQDPLLCWECLMRSRIESSKSRCSVVHGTANRVSPLLANGLNHGRQQSRRSFLKSIQISRMPIELMQVAAVRSRQCNHKPHTLVSKESPVG